MTTTRRRLIPLRRGDGADRVTNVELFFDLVYVFAVTQLSHLLVEHPTARGALQAAVLLAVVWQVWVYTTWWVNYLDPDHTLVRAALLVQMLGSLLLAAAVPGAYHEHGLLVALTFAGLQVGRAALTIASPIDRDLRMIFARILAWSGVSSVLMVVGGLQPGAARPVLWAVAVAVELGAAAFGFWTPTLGRSTTTDWTISGSHFAERCQAFVLIALGESVVVIGGLAHLDDPGSHDIIGFVGAFAGVVGLWWIYFDSAAEHSSRLIAASEDPGRLARSAYHWVHPVIVAGIIVTAAADEKILEHPARPGTAVIGGLTYGGVALFLGGHALFKAVVWRAVAWSRLVGVVALGLLWFIASHVSALTIGLTSLGVIVLVCVADRITPHDAPPGGAL